MKEWPMYQEVQADLLNHEDLLRQTDFVLHGCNCQKTFGSGIAALIADGWPEMYRADLNDTRSPSERFGSYTEADVHRVAYDFIGLNVYSQFFYGPPSEKHFDIDKFTQALITLEPKVQGKKVLMPMVGSGKGGGNWEDIKQRIKTVWGSVHVTVCYL